MSFSLSVVPTLVNNMRLCVTVLEYVLKAFILGTNRLLSHSSCLSLSLSLSLRSFLLFRFSPIVCSLDRSIVLSFLSSSAYVAASRPLHALFSPLPSLFVSHFASLSSGSRIRVLSLDLELSNQHTEFVRYSLSLSLTLTPVPFTSTFFAPLPLLPPPPPRLLLLPPPPPPPPPLPPSPPPPCSSSRHSHSCVISQSR